MVWKATARALFFQTYRFSVPSPAVCTSAGEIIPSHTASLWLSPFAFPWSGYINAVHLRCGFNSLVSKLCFHNTIRRRNGLPVLRHMIFRSSPPSISRQWIDRIEVHLVFVCQQYVAGECVAVSENLEPNRISNTAFIDNRNQFGLLGDRPAVS